MDLEGSSSSRDEDSGSGCTRTLSDLDVPSAQCPLMNPPSKLMEAASEVEESRLELLPTSTGSSSSSQDPQEGQDAHPCLLNEDILDNIFKYLIVKGEHVRTVQSLRLVCKTWRNSATRLYRRTAVLERYSWRCYLERFRQFVNLMEKSDMILIRNYNFVYNIFKEDKDYEVLRNFLRVCGPEVVSLNLCFSDIHRPNIDLSGLRLRDLNLGKLTNLQLKVSQDVDSKVQAQGLVNFLRVILNAASTLRELQFEFAHPPDLAIRNEIFEQQYGEIISKGIAKTVKKLSLKMILHEETFNNLMEKGVKLEQFEFGLYTASGTIREFLKSQSFTLKDLHITACITGAIEFPPLNELVYLKLGKINVEPFGFPEAFPKLISFDVGGWDNADTFAELLSFESRPVQSLRKIHLPSHGTAQLVKKVSVHFPNIKELYVSLNSEDENIPKALQEVYIHFSDIEHLHISMYLAKYFRLNADSMFSGISDENCRRICRRSNFDSENLMKLQRLPSILNLTNLKKLVLNHGPGGHFILSDMCAHFVFLQMPQLEELELSGLSNVSYVYYKLLKDKMNFRINGRYGERYDYSSHSDDSDQEESDSSSDCFCSICHSIYDISSDSD